MGRVIGMILLSWGLSVRAIALESHEKAAPSLLKGTPFSLNRGTLHFNDDRYMEEIKKGRSEFNGVRAIYTIDTKLQKEVEDFFKQYKVPYGVFIAIEPHTGKLLAMVEYSTHPNARTLSLRATYPAASIFKLITASALLEEKKAIPTTTVAYRGGCAQLGPENWKDSKKDRSRIMMADALAKSCNAPFAKLALRFLNVPILLEYGEQFGFNQVIPFELPIQISRMKIGFGTQELAEAAAGFGDVGLSPLHAALIGAVIANDGVMMTPCVVDRILDPQGMPLYQCEPKPLTRVIAPETARVLRTMMGLTVLKGTSRKAFNIRQKKIPLEGVTVAGKTGSLTGKDPPGHVNWFVGMAPIDDPEIAVAALVINQDRWKIKAADVAKRGFATFFDYTE